jgi:starch phosphorylase
VFNYTNHTLLPEALEKWPVSLMERLLPRHMQIIYLINAEHLDALRARGGADAPAGDGLAHRGERRAGACAWGTSRSSAAHKVNGVSALHTELMRQTVFKDFHALYPTRIVNKTNGITFRRWLFEANPGLTALISDTIGPAFTMTWSGSATSSRSPTTPTSAPGSPPCAAPTRSRSRIVTDTLGTRLDPDALFDVHIKRIHEYKRQLLNILETIAIYNAMRARPG